ncbi:MAG: hypothetical protein LBM18_04315 [Oscillospiraceae bacterium]|jgi:hypothetical protein|nr:hypothetical protein [Oscillospiraceae bacterium]
MRWIILILIFALVYTDGSEERQITKEIFEYVEQNNDNIEFETTTDCYAFYYDSTGSWDTQVDYGYYYSENDVPLFAHGSLLYGDSIYGYEITPQSSQRLGRGYKIDGIYGDELDWYYTEKICDHWYYYEVHDG